jgi:ABC-2 type transport system permease protein
MRTLKFLLEKEFRQILRNKALLKIIFLAPIVQLFLLPLAADYSVKNILLAIVDNDHSSYSQKLISKITSSGHFKLVSFNSSYKKAYTLIENDKADLILEIPTSFERDMVDEKTSKVLMAINAIEGTKAGLGGAYLAR